MASTSKNEEIRCDGCGKQFDSREKLEQHARECVGMARGSSGEQKTRTAGGQSRES